MQLGLVRGSITATAKAAPLTGQKLLVVDIVDSAGKLISAGHVAPDTVGAGQGDTVLLTQGSAARMAAGLSAAPVDLAIVAIVDRISV